MDMHDEGLSGTGGTIWDCARRFVEERRQCHASRGFRSDGERVLSYAQPIAQWSGRTLEIECRKFSMTTSSHQAAIAYAAQRAGVPTVCRRLGHRATFQDPLLMEEMGPDMPTSVEARRIRDWSRTRAGGQRAEARRRADRVEAEADVLMADIRRRQAANRRWVAKMSAEAQAWLVETMTPRMRTPRTWTGWLERRGIEYDGPPFPEAWTDRNDHHWRLRIDETIKDAGRIWTRRGAGG